MMILGSGEFRYGLVEGWAKWRDDIETGVVSAVATDSADRVYLVIREPTPVIHVFSPDGDYLRSWGRDLLKKPHSIWIGADDEVLISDVISHKVLRFSTEGELLEAFDSGVSGPFCKPTWAVRHASGELFVAGGYGQNCVHRLARDGTPRTVWGETGKAPGYFSTPHGIRVDSRNRVLVVDRGNSRIQLFDLEGRFLKEWDFLWPANDLFVDREDRVFVAECDRRISILSPEGAILSQLQSERPFRDFFHGVWLDSQGSLYVTEVKASPGRIHKLVRV